MSQENICSTNRTKSKEAWKPLDRGVFKLNFDAAYHNKSRIATTTVLARDSEAGIRGLETYLFTDVNDCCVAEARAYERTLLFVVEGGYRCLIVEGDSLTRSVNRTAHMLAVEGRRRQAYGA